MKKRILFVLLMFKGGSVFGTQLSPRISTPIVPDSVLLILVPLLKVEGQPKNTSNK